MGVELELATIEDIWDELHKRAPIGAFLFFVPGRGLVAGETLSGPDYERALKFLCLAHQTFMAEFLRTELEKNNETRRKLIEELGLDGGLEDGPN